jgi:hypothetical protein
MNVCVCVYIYILRSRTSGIVIMHLAAALKIRERQTHAHGQSTRWRSRGFVENVASMQLFYFNCNNLKYSVHKIYIHLCSFSHWISVHFHPVEWLFNNWSVWHRKWTNLQSMKFGDCKQGGWYTRCSSHKSRWKTCHHCVNFKHRYIRSRQSTYTSEMWNWKKMEITKYENLELLIMKVFQQIWFFIYQLCS